MRETREALKIWFCLDTLEFLRRGGRVGKAQAWLGGTLRIKPILSLEFEIVPVERVRTAGRAFERMVRYAEELHEAGSDGWVVQHIQAPEQCAAPDRALPRDLRLRAPLHLRSRPRDRHLHRAGPDRRRRRAPLAARLSARRAGPLNVQSPARAGPSPPSEGSWRRPGTAATGAWGPGRCAGRRESRPRPGASPFRAIKLQRDSNFAGHSCAKLLIKPSKSILSLMPFPLLTGLGAEVGRRRNFFRRRAPAAFFALPRLPFAFARSLLFFRGLSFSAFFFRLFFLLGGLFFGLGWLLLLFLTFFRPWSFLQPWVFPWRLLFRLSLSRPLLRVDFGRLLFDFLGGAFFCAFVFVAALAWLSAGRRSARAAR